MNPSERGGMLATCPRCGVAAHSEGARFCSRCGLRLRGESGFKAVFWFGAIVVVLVLLGWALI